MYIASIGIGCYYWFAGGEKKAKSFDFMAMFEEARKTAVERNQEKNG